MSRDAASYTEAENNLSELHEQTKQSISGSYWKFIIFSLMHDISNFSYSFSFPSSFVLETASQFFWYSYSCRARRALPNHIKILRNDIFLQTLEPYFVFAKKQCVKCLVIMNKMIITFHNYETISTIFFSDDSSSHSLQNCVFQSTIYMCIHIDNVIFLERGRNLWNTLYL